MKIYLWTALVMDYLSTSISILFSTSVIKIIFMNINVNLTNLVCCYLSVKLCDLNTENVYSVWLPHSD